MLPGLLQEGGQLRDGEGAGGGVPRVEHDARHGADSEATGQGLVRTDRVAERCAVAEVGALGGVRPHQPFPQGVAAAAVLAEVEEPVDVEAVHRAGVRQSVVEAGLGGFTADCPARSVLNHVSSRWGVLILAALQDGPMRFYVLRDRIGGISEKMLSQTLRTFVRDGLVAREVEPTVPPQVTYSLTPLGSELAGTVGVLVEWIARRIDEILAARERYDRA